MVYGSQRLDNMDNMVRCIAVCSILGSISVYLARKCNDACLT